VYYSYFGFSENPFNLTPDPRYLYLSGYHKEALDHLLYGINERKGFIAVTGGIGTGKTTLCRALLRQLGELTKSALIFSSFITELELLQQINQEFGIASGTSVLSKKKLMDDLNVFLLENFGLGGNAVVLIDEAQNLSHPVLEQLRMLSNLETEREKLIQIVLVGQPELAEILASPSLRQLDERIAVRYHLKPLGRKDVAGYVGHRLAVAGGSGRVRFTGSAIGELYKFSGGNPRRVNAVCDRALLIAYARETFTVERGIVSDAVKDLQGGMPADNHNRTGGSIFSKQILLLVSLLLILTWVVWQNMEDIAGSFSSNIGRRPGSTAGNEISGEAGEVGIEVLASEDVEAISNTQEMEQPEMFDVYLGGPASAAGLLFLGESAESLENESGLRIVHFQVPPEFQLLFRKPFRIRIDSSDREDNQEFYIVVVRYGDSGAVLLDAKWQERPVTRQFMLDHWSSSVSWLVSGEMETETLSIGSISPKVYEMQKTLNELGYQHEINGRYGNSTMTAVRLFQQDMGLKPDGLAGPRTLTLLEMLKPDEKKEPRRELDS
jgi:general secretion pathway protein A